MSHVIEHPESIAVIGMAGRFPQAPNVDEFWNNLAAGKESVTFFSAKELKEAGYPETAVKRDDFIGASAVVDDIDVFDAPFFQCTAQEAELMDPQHRLFLESCWQALRQGGYTAEEAQSVGVFAGCGISTYMMAVAPKFNSEPLNPMLQLLMGNDKDYLASRVSYKLNLTGPSLCVQSACSTSLLSVHTAIQSLLNGECEMALAGGVDISIPQKMGYEYQDGMIFSNDGHCRPFDQQAKGTVAGNGCGVVLLKPLDDALRDGDNVLAVIRGSAVNNDGADKIGYTAPSVQGQASVIADALAAADVGADSIGYVEAHGTGTPLGDPIEVRALNQVFSEEQALKGVCALGSVKSNIGHLNAAAGIAALIKIQSVRYGKVCPSLHFTQANPEIEFDQGPFFVSSSLQDWPLSAGPRRAGVSSFGFGGTNVHMVLEQSPVADMKGSVGKEHNSHLVTISAHSQEQLNKQLEVYQGFLCQSHTGEGDSIGDLAFTSLYARPHYDYKHAFAVNSAQDLLQQLQSLAPVKGVLPTKGSLTAKGFQKTVSIGLLFTGQGSLTPGVGEVLYQQQPEFKRALDECASLLEQWLDKPLTQVLFDPAISTHTLQRADYAQPALFALEYALAKMWINVGVEIEAVAGHSVGEFVAACIAGVFDLATGLEIICIRGRLIQQLEGDTGTMLAVFASKEEVTQYLTTYPELAIGAQNGPALTVISGDTAAVERFKQEMEKQSIRSKALDVTHGFHSAKMDLAMAPFEQVLSKFEFNAPQIAFFSNLYGRELAAGEVTDAAYWVEHLRQPVLFMSSVQAMATQGVNVFMECGPGAVLSRLGASCIEPLKTLDLHSHSSVEYQFIASLKPKTDDIDGLNQACAALYCAGVELNWSEAGQRLGLNQGGHKTSLPDYSLARHRYWLARVDEGLHNQGQISSTDLWNTTIEEAERQAKGSLAALDLPSLQRDQDVLVKLAQAYVAQALVQLNLFVDDNTYSHEHLMSAARVIPQYAQLLERLLDELVEGNRLTRVDGGYQSLVATSTSEIEAFKANCGDAFSQHPSFAQVFCLAGERLAEVLSGKRPAIEAMMGGSSLDETRSIYADLPTSKYFNALLRESVKGWLTAVGRSAPLKIIEIGAGTGATSEQLLPVLPLQRSQYVFTDVSPLFLDSASERFGDYPFVAYQLYDINRPVCEQGLEVNSFDLVVASNVLHAADDLTYTMGQVSRLLKPGAMLLMYEIVNETLIGELTTGLLLPEVKDNALRGNQPFMTEPQWQTLLVEQGFERFASLPELSEHQQALGERVIYATKGQQLSATTPDSVSANKLYQLQWQAEAFIDASHEQQQGADTSPDYLLVSSAQRVDHALIKHFTSTEHSSDNARVTHCDIGQVAARLPALLQSDSDKAVQVIYLSESEFALENETLLGSQQSTCYENLLTLLDVLASSDKTQLAGLSLVTCGAQDPGACLQGEQLNVMQGAFWGFAQVVALGHPELKVSLIDLDPVHSAEQKVQSLKQVAIQQPHEGEYQQVIRGGEVFYPRLAHYFPEPDFPEQDFPEQEFPEQAFPEQAFPEQGACQALALDPQGWYLLAGGLGGLGLETADWLIESGAKKLLLLGRSQPNSRQQKRVNQWRSQGIQVRVEQIDICHRQSVLSIGERLDTPLKGIFHCAVVRDAQQLGEMSPLERAMAVMEPKVQGAWNLHLLSLNCDLDWFVVYSSSVALVPARGLPEYVAANSFLDKLCTLRQRLGMPALSVNWGAWSEVGTVADSTQAKRLEQGGLHALSPQQSLAQLELLMEHKGKVANTGVISADWGRMLANYPQHQLNGYFSQVLAKSERQSASVNHQYQQQADSELLQAIEQHSETDKRLELIRQFVSARVGQIVRRPAEQIPTETDLMQLGVDSLMFLDLLNGLNQGLKTKVKPNEVMANLTIDAIARALMQSLLLIEQGESQDSGQVPLVKRDSEAFDPFALTDVQQAYWVGRDQKMDLGNVACHGYLEIDCEHLDVNTLEQAWNNMVQRHPMLRCIILPQGLQQVLADVPRYEFSRADFRHLTVEEREQGILQIRQQMSHKVPDTSQWPLFEIRVSHLSAHTSRLHISLDNIMTDGRSIGIMLSEWVRVYQQPAQSLPELNVSFRDYVCSLEAYRQSEDYREAKQYWLGRLDQVYPSPQLPLVKDVSQIRSPQFKRRSFQMSPQQWQNLKQRGAEQAGLTPSGLLLSVYACTLSRWSQRRQFTLNVPTFSRLPVHEQVNDIVGEFTSLILVSVDLNTEAPFAHIASQIQKQLLKEQSFDSFSGVQVMRELVRHTGEPQRANMPVVFTSTFGLTEQADTGFSENEQKASALGEQVYTISQTPQVYIDNHVHDHGGRLNVHWDTVDELFPVGVLDEMFAYYSQLLEALADDNQDWMDTWHHPIPTDLSAVQQQHRLEYNASGVELSGSDNLLEGVITQINKTPNGLALQTEELELTYAQLGGLVNRLATELKLSGLSSQQPVVVMLPKGWQQVVSVMAVLACGGIYVPVDFDSPQKRRAELIAAVGARHLLSWSDTSQGLDKTVTLIDVDKVLNSEHITAEGAHSHWLNSEFDYHYSQPDDLAYVIYTSGSTGQPKGVKITHGAACNTLKDINRRFKVSHQDGVFALSALNFDLSVYDIFGALSAGARVVIPSALGTKDPAHWLALMERFPVTVWNSVPQLCQMLLIQAASSYARVVSNLRLAMLSGDWIPLSLPQQLANLSAKCELISLGGATEASVWSIYFPVEGFDPDWNSIPYGYPLSNQSIHVFDEQCKPCPEWVEGDLYIGGIGLAQGYWQDKTRTDAAFVRHPHSGEPLYRTGDRGRFMPQGYVEFMGRRDHQVKVNGHRIELGEIESALSNVSGVTQAVVITHGVRRAGANVPLQQTKQQLLAYFVAEDAGTNSDGIRQVLATSLPEYMLPQHIVQLDALPLSSNGKVDRGRLPLPLVRAELAVESRLSQLPQTPLESQIVLACQQILGREEVGLNDHFFEIGGDSLAATRISVLLKEQGISLSVRDIFSTPVLSELSARLSQGVGEDSQQHAPVLLNQHQPKQNALFCIHGSDGDILVFRQFAQALNNQLNVYAQGVMAGIQGLSLDKQASAYLEQLRKVQPSGPYRLCGYSSGGLLAWEMASQLQAKGETVEQLSLIDSGQLPQTILTRPLVVLCLYGLSVGLPESELKLTESQLRDLLEAEFRAVDFSAVAVLSERELSEETGRLAELAHARSSLTREGFVEGYTQFYASVESSVRYTLPTLTQVPTLLLQTMAVDAEFSLAHFWRQYDPELTIHQVKGDHFTCMQSPNVEGLTQNLVFGMGQLTEAQTGTQSGTQSGQASKDKGRDTNEA